MSIRASLISAVLRRTLKKRMAAFEDPAEVRTSGGIPGGRMPAALEVQPLQVAGVPAQWVGRKDGSETDVLLYLHGGGYVFGGLDSHRDIAWRLADKAGVRVLQLDYRLAPEHPYPAAVEDATNAYRWLLEQGTAPEHIVVAGDSAGGGLAAALMLNLKNLSLPQPRAAVLMSPWADLAMTGDSLQTYAEADAMLSPAAVGKFAALYLQGADARAPLASPVFGDLSGLPPVCILVGSEEVLRSDAETLAERIRAAGGEVELAVWPRMPHVFPILAAIIPEGKQAIEDMAGFIRRHLDA